jgi:hypothetical protein
MVRMYPLILAHHCDNVVTISTYVHMIFVPGMARINDDNRYLIPVELADNCPLVPSPKVATRFHPCHPTIMKSLLFTADDNCAYAVEALLRP